jgi:ABC-type dipeptide/oligopeptide/nickel transport system permease subunit
MTSVQTKTKTPTGAPLSVSGVQLAKGIGVRPARGFWADAWSTVLSRKAAVLALIWLSIVTFFGVYGPLIASGHPWYAQGPVVNTTPPRVPVSPLLSNLSAIDLVLIIWVTAGVGFTLLGSKKDRAARMGMVIGGLVIAVTTVGVSLIVQGALERGANETAREIQTEAIRTGKAIGENAFRPFFREDGAGFLVSAMIGLPVLLATALLPVGQTRTRLIVALAAILLSIGCVGARWRPKLEQWDYQQQLADGRLTSATFTLIPWSPFQRFSELSRLAPGSSRWRGAIEQATRSLPPYNTLTTDQITSIRTPLESALQEAPAKTREAILQQHQSILSASSGANASHAGSPPGGVTREYLRATLDHPASPQFHFGTDKDGADVLTQLLHACRLSISIGLVSTGVAFFIGVTIGALMGYFGGWVDLLLYRVVEIFMAVPVLFLLIVAVAVLPEDLKTTYFMMAIIGCFTWTGMARFTRAEFMKLRNQDFVQSAEAVGVPLPSILFRHMLPNGVAPVLVDTSFAIAAAISVEATLSYLGLGPVDAASWGKLLSSAISSEGEFKWWLAVFPGMAIFLTVLSYNMLGETLRDAIDPRLKKARV